MSTTPTTNPFTRARLATLAKAEREASSTIQLDGRTITLNPEADWSWPPEGLDRLPKDPKVEEAR